MRNETGFLSTRTPVVVTSVPEGKDSEGLWP